MFFINISSLHVSGGFVAHHQELIKLYVKPCLFSCFPAVYRWCGWVGTCRALIIIKNMYKLYLVGYIKYTSSDERFHERYKRVSSFQINVICMYFCSRIVARHFSSGIQV